MPKFALSHLLGAGLLALAIVAPAAPATAEPIKFARYPHVANGKLVFSYHGDIWIAAQDGSNPTRLTAHVRPRHVPRLSPDGTRVAFTSNRFGNDDVFVIPVTGGEPRQLTFNTTGDVVQNWTPDGKGIIFSTQRSISPWLNPLYVVPVEGGLPHAMDMDTANTGMIKQDGSMARLHAQGGRLLAEGEQGQSDRRHLGSGRQVEEDHQAHRSRSEAVPVWVHDTSPMWGADGQIYFASERDEIFNIWRIAPTGGAPAQVTRHRQDGDSVSVDQPGRQGDRLRERVRAVDADVAERHATARHDRHGVRSEGQPDHVGEHARTGRGILRRRPTATTRRSISAARSSSSRPRRRLARRRR